MAKTTDPSERGLERLICTALTGHPCDPPKEDQVAERRCCRNLTPSPTLSLLIG